MKYVRENINETFVEKSDPITDMGIGMDPEDLLTQFLMDYETEFRLELYVDYIGRVYDQDLSHADILAIQSQHDDAEYPISKIIGTGDGETELNFAKTDRAANQIVDGAKWGFFYWYKSKQHAIKSKDLRGVIKEILKIRKTQRRSLDTMIRKYNHYISQAQKLTDIFDEGR